VGKAEKGGGGGEVGGKGIVEVGDKCRGGGGGAGGREVGG